VARAQCRIRPGLAEHRHQARGARRRQGVRRCPQQA
jgi:hypothetical protein